MVFLCMCFFNLFFLHNIKGVSANIYTETEDNVLRKRKKIKKNIKTNKQQQKGDQIFFRYFFVFFFVFSLQCILRTRNSKKKINTRQQIHKQTAKNKRGKVYFSSYFCFFSFPEMCSWILPRQQRAFPGRLCALWVQRSVCWVWGRDREVPGKK